MIWSRRLLFGIVCLFAIGMDGFDRHRVAAAGAAAPTVGIRRNPVFVGPVRTGDFNGDGFADLVGSTADPANPSGPAVVTVGLSKADGSLGTLVRTHVPGTILAVGDLNADGKLDVLVRTVVSNGGQAHSELSALRGNGDGTFAASPSVVMSVSYVFFALIADFDGDGHLDIGAAVDRDGDDNMAIQQGDGDFTFTFVRDLGGGGDTPFAGAVADLNGDGKADIVTANGEFNSLSLYLNQGALQFTSSQMTLAHVANDVAAADLNGDGRVDLVIAASDNPHPAYHEGYATVLRGVGGGAFAAPVDYPTAPGAYNVVLGDFNRDGIIDIATANRSEIYYDALCDPRQTWDSISIFPGMTAGIGARSDFSIGNQMKPHDTTTDRNTVESLASGDLNGDHAVDLVTSNGTVFLNKSADPNWAPTVDAGPDQTINDPDDHFVHLYATASDVDQDMLTYTWFDSGGESIPPVPAPCFSPHTLGVHTYTVVVDDGHGHTASDSVQVDFGSGGTGTSPMVTSIDAPSAGEIVAAGEPYTIRWTATAGSAPIARFDLTYSLNNGASYQTMTECRGVSGSARSCTWTNPPVSQQARIVVLATDTSGDNALRTSDPFVIRSSSGLADHGWSDGDVGNVGAAGSASYDGLVWNGDALTVTGSGADIWGTADAFHFAWKHVSGDFSIDTRVSSLEDANAWTKGGLMIRAAATDASSPHASIFVSPSKGIAFQRRTAEGGASTSTAGPALTAPLWFRMTRQGAVIRAYYRKNVTDAWTKLGEQTIGALGGGVDVGLATTSHADGSLARATFGGVFVGPLPTLTASPFGGATGTISGDGTTFTATGSGSDIWGTSDSFLFFNTPIGENRQITIRVRSLANTDAWAKAGVMIRESLTAGSRHADLVVSPSKGVALQDRSTTGGASASPIQVNGAAPIWLRIMRFEPSSGTPSFTATYSQDGTTWFNMGSVNVTMAHGAYIGIALTSHKAGTQTTAIVDDIRIEP